MPTAETAPRILGRDAELAALEAFRNSLLRGSSGVLVVHGEAGIGKTTLLEGFVAGPPSCRIETFAGIESEMELSWAGLHQLCSPMLAHLDSLPEPQRATLRRAFGLASGPAPDPFLVGLAVLGLLTDVAETKPLICVVDDAQFLDRSSRQALAFVSRRLQDESVGLIFAVREVPPEFEGLADLPVRGLSDADAAALLDSVAYSTAPTEVRQRLIDETRGNPLAIVTFSRGARLRELAGGYEVGASEPLKGRIEDSFRETVTSLAPDVQRVLLIAAADATGDPALVRRASVRAGLEIPDTRDKTIHQLLSITSRVRFRHPLVRSAVYEAASAAERREAHRALAEATNPRDDPDRKVWHLAQSLDRQDEAVARELEESATRARDRGGFAGAAAFLTLAAQLSPDGRQRGRRELDAATDAFQSGDAQGAIDLLQTAEARDLDAGLFARAERLRGQIAFHTSRGDLAPKLLLKAARALEPFDPRVSRETYLEAILAAVYGGPPSVPVMRETAAAVLASAPSVDPPRPIDLLLDGQARWIAEGVPAGTSAMATATKALMQDWPPSPETMRFMWTAYQSCLDVFDFESCVLIAERQVQLARASGALLILGIAYVQLGAAHLLQADIATGSALMHEAIAVSEDVGAPAPRYALLTAEALRGDERVFQELAGPILANALESGEGHVLSYHDLMLSILRNAQGRWEEALGLARGFFETGYASYQSVFAFEYAEAAAKTGEVTERERARKTLLDLTADSSHGWARGTRAMVTALLGDPSERDRHFRKAISELGGVKLWFYLCRAHLLYGEWLRDQERRTESREQLQIARDMTSKFGMNSFSARANRALSLLGETSRRRRQPGPDDDLTSQELQVAQMAAAGLSNRDIGERLFLSHRTVASHLYRVYPKLGITSRSQLHLVLPAQPVPEANADL